MMMVLGTETGLSDVAEQRGGKKKGKGTGRQVWRWALWADLSRGKAVGLKEGQR